MKKEEKIKFFVYLLAKLVKKSDEYFPPHKTGFIDLEKVIQYPFIFSIANDEAGRRKIFKEVFTNFKANRRGLVEIEIGGEIIEMINKGIDLFHPYFALIDIRETNSPGTNSREFKTTIRKNAPLIDPRNLENIFLNPYDKPRIENKLIEKEFGKEYLKLMDNMVNNIHKIYPNFVLIDVKGLGDINRWYSVSYRIQKIWNFDTNFRKNNNSETFEYYCKDGDFYKIISSLKNTLR